MIRRVSLEAARRLHLSFLQVDLFDPSLWRLLPSTTAALAYAFPARSGNSTTAATTHSHFSFTMSDAQVFEDTFTINEVNTDKYDRVARLKGVSQDNSVDLILDINTELFPVERGEAIDILLANTIRLDGVKDDAKSGWRDVQKGDQQTLADMYDYVCHGKVYRVTGDESSGVRYHTRSPSPRASILTHVAARCTFRLEAFSWFCPVPLES
jgi:DNA-directed RNA polymerase I, II, and III subunit RPABC3